jgi:hypothetical protein
MRLKGAGVLRGKIHFYHHNSTPLECIILKSMIKLVFFAAVSVLLLGGAHALAVDLDIRIGAGGSGPASTGSPPAHAPAHGVRSKTYQYYPSANVYFEPVQGMYFYLSEGEWKAGVSLPEGPKVQLGDHVSLELGTDRPYELNADHIIKYKPGKGGSSGKNKKSFGKGKGKGKKK